MSKLVDRLKQAAQTSPQPMGFRMAKKEYKQPRMVLVASLSVANIKNLADTVAGADGGLFTVAPEALSGTLEGTLKTGPDVAWGARLESGSRAEIEQVVKTACDFIVFPADKTSLAVMQHNELGKVLEVEDTAGDSVLLAIKDLPVDALLLTMEKDVDYYLSYRHLIQVQRFAGLSAKPLLIPVPVDVTADELQALWEAGVDGVLVGAGSGEPEGRVGELRKLIDGLTLPSTRKRSKREPLLPFLSQGRISAAEEEEEE